MRRIALIGATLAIVSGCGGSAPVAPSWAARADAICTRAVNRIAERHSWPEDVGERGRRVPAGARADRGARLGERRARAADACAADRRGHTGDGGREIDRLPGARPDARRFVAALHALEPQLDDLTRAGATMDLHGSGAAANGIRAPVMAERLWRVNTAFKRRLETGRTREERLAALGAVGVAESRAFERFAHKLGALPVSRAPGADSEAES